MSKFTTRKSVAVVSALALGIAGLSGPGAFAAGTIDGKVTLVPSSGTTYSMVTGQAFDLATNFATSAKNGTKLKFLVTDASLISKYDASTTSINDFDTTIATADNIDDTAVTNKAAGDEVTFAFDTAPGVEVGDAIGVTTGLTSLTDAQETELNGNSFEVIRVNTVGSANLTQDPNAVAVTDGTGSILDTVTVTQTHSFVEGDIVTIASSSTAYLDGIHRVTAANGTTAYSFEVAATSVSSNATLTLSAGTRVGNSLTIVASAAFAAADANALSETAGKITELTDGDELDAASEVLVATFGLAAASGLAATKTTGVAGRNTDGSYILDTTDIDDASVDHTLRLVATAAGSVSVQAWIDSDNDNVIDTNEYASDLRTVTFVDYDDVSFTTALTAVVLADTTINATVSLANDINMAQIPNGTVTVDFKKNGTTVSGQGAVVANYDSTLKVLDSTTSTQSALSAGTFSATATWVPAAAVVGVITYGTTTSALTDVSSVSTPVSAGSATVAGSAVKTGTTTVPITSAVKYWTVYNASAGSRVEALVPAGVPVTVTVTKSVLAAGSTVSAGGKTLASTGTSISFNTTTAALGVVAFDLTATGTKATSVTVVVAAQDQNTASDGAAAGSTAGFKTSSALTLTWGDATVADVTDTTVTGFKASAGVGQMAKGGSYTLNYDVRDNFGAASAVAGTYRMYLSTTVNAGGATTWINTPAVTGGKASYTFTDNSISATGNITVAAKLQKLNAAGTTYEDVASITESTVIHIGTVAATAVTATTKATDALAIEEEDFITGDLRLDANTQSHLYTGSAGWEVTGLVTSSTGAPVPGAVVTISAPGIAFVAPTSVDGTFTDGLAAIGSITVSADATGAYTVDAWSHLSGSHTFSVTSGAASTTTSQTWAYPATFVSTSTITITMPATASPASVLKGSVALADKWGNAVKNAQAISFVQTGPGYIVTTPSTVSATTGTAEFVLLTGSNDTGTVTITVTHALGTASDATDDIVATASATIGAVASSATKVTVGTYKGYVAVFTKGYEGQKLSVRLASKWHVVPTIVDLAAGYSLKTINTGVGYVANVIVYIDGVEVQRKTITTK
jgi:hypothetical protein